MEGGGEAEAGAMLATAAAVADLILAAEAGIVVGEDDRLSLWGQG